MIISHKYKFIFLKTSKTAGTSIEIALSEFCDEDDIITPISPKDERIRSDLGFCGPQNFISSFKEYEFLDWINFFFKYKNKRKRQYYNHITASRAKRLLGEKRWKEYYKFCFVRNPWDRVVSQYYWRTQEPRPHISKFLKSKHFKDLYKKGENIYKINNEIVVDKVYKFENINSRLPQPVFEIMYDSRIVLIPIHEDFIRKIDKVNNIIYLDIPDGLLEII